MSDEPQVFAKGPLAELLGMAPRSMEKFIAEAPVFKEERGVKYYQPKDVIRAALRGGYAGWGLPRGKKASPEAEEAKDEKTLYDRARRKKIELQVMMLENKVVPLEAVTKFVSTLATTTRQKLLGLVNRIAGAVQTIETAEEIAAYIQKELTAALEDLADGRVFNLAADESLVDDEEGDDLESVRGRPKATAEPEDE
jgi:hypothetical protein